MSRSPLWKKVAYEKACEQIWLIEDDPRNKVNRLTDYHWKINGMDVWPSALKYMKNGIVRRYDDLIELIEKER